MYWYTCCPLPEPYLISCEWSLSPDCWFNNLNVERHVTESWLDDIKSNKKIKNEHWMIIFILFVLLKKEEKNFFSVGFIDWLI
jgi:hypothetical protein